MATWQVIHGDCLEVLRTLPAGSVDAVVTDPPYGIDLTPGDGKLNATQHRKVHGDTEPFDPAPILALNVPTVLWGANNFADRLPRDGAWLAWDKVTQNGMNLRIAEYEFAWTNATARHQGFRHMWSGAYRASERGTSFHPCQKPVSLLAWCLGIVGAESGWTVIDPYCGSGSLGVACVMREINYIGIEIDAGYCEIARRRIAEAANHLYAEASA
jgi:site-specific DNA-methyltransferase (adenine-specific)